MSVSTVIQIKARAQKLDRKDRFGKSDPFMEIKHRGVVLARTEVIMSSLSPSWSIFQIAVNDAGGMHTILTFEVWDWDGDGGHDFIGSFETTLDSFCSRIGTQWVLINPRKKGLFYKNSGYVIVESATQQQMRVPEAFRVKFQARGLPRMDNMGLSKSDPFIEIYALQGEISYQFLSKTSFIPNNSNPIWEEVLLLVNLCGGMNATLLIRVFDHNSNGAHDFIGEVETNLREIAASSPMWPIINPKKKSPLYTNSGKLLVASCIPTEPDYSFQHITQLHFKCKGEKLDKKDILGKSDPYFKIKRGDVQIYQSEIIKNTLNPEWEPFTLTVEACAGLDTRLKFEVWDWDKITKDDHIGDFTVTLRQLLFYKKNPKWRIVHPKKDGSILYTSSGLFVVNSIDIDYAPAHRRSVAADQGSYFGSSSYSSAYGSGSCNQPNPQMGMQHQSAIPQHQPNPPTQIAFPAPVSLPDPRAKQQAPLNHSQAVSNYDSSNSYLDSLKQSQPNTPTPTPYTFNQPSSLYGNSNSQPYANRNQNQSSLYAPAPSSVISESVYCSNGSNSYHANPSSNYNNYGNSSYNNNNNNNNNYSNNQSYQNNGNQSSLYSNSNYSNQPPRMNGQPAPPPYSANQGYGMTPSSLYSSHT